MGIITGGIISYSSNNGIWKAPSDCVVNITYSSKDARGRLFVGEWLYARSITNEEIVIHISGEPILAGQSIIVIYGGARIAGFTV